VTTAIVLFLAFGACFGLATFSHRHLFSEGPARKDQAGDSNDTLLQRAIWVLSCSGLWPLMVLTGLVALWKQRRVRVQRVQEQRVQGRRDAGL
jgi:hypothetical protein